MPDHNKNSINMAIRLCERKGLSYKKITLVGSNFMSKVASLQELPHPQRRFAVLAQKEHRNAEGYRDGGPSEWFTFTLTGRERTLKNERAHADERAAEVHHDKMVDEGII